MATKRKCKFDIIQLDSFCTKIGSSVLENETVQYLEISLNELEKKWNKSTESYEQFVLEEEAIDFEAEQKDNISLNYEKVNDKARKLKAILIALISSNKTETQSESQAEKTAIHPSMTLKLPPCDIEIFEGGYAKWPAFRDMFQAVIGNHPHLTPAQKLYHLRSKTRGEANQIVKRFELVDKEFELAWEALRTRFENPRILAHQQIKQMFGLQAIHSENAKSLRHIRSVLNENLAIFESLQLTKSWDAILIYLCASKLPEETMRSWENSLIDHKNWPTWQDMSAYLTNRIEMLETVSDMRKSYSKENPTMKSQSFHSRTGQTKLNFSCKECNQNHALRFCKKFKSLSVSDRIKYVFSKKYCVNCLSPNHFKSKCPSTSLCILCNQKHHTMLHSDHQNKEVEIPKKSHNFPLTDEKPSFSGAQRSKTYFNTQISHPSTQDSSHTEPVRNYFSRHEGTTILPTAVVNIEHFGEKFVARVLLDAGSERTFISTRIQQHLSLPIESYNSQISGLGGTVVGKSKGKCSIILKSRVSDFRLKLQAIVVSKLSHLLPSRPIKIQNLEKIKHLNLADPYFFQPSTIDMIIGSDYLPLINLSGVKPNIANCLEARESHFGWYLSGPVPDNEINTFTTIVHSSEHTTLQEQLKKFWELEEAEKSYLESESDNYCEEFYQNTTTRRADGKYIVRLPFKPEFPQDIFLGPSRNMALAQYSRMEKTLEKSPTLKKEYENVIQEYLDLDHMEPTAHFESQTERQQSFYLPHHAVIRPESKTTKLRVVFNASKKTISGFSLNDVLHQGPALQTDLMQIVMNWRHYKYVFTGDIQKMYRQILVNEADRPYQKILFRDKKQGAVKSFQLKTVTFGVNCAPFLAIRTLHELSKDCHKIYPIASNILKNEIYVDDILSGGHTLNEAKTKQEQLIKALSSAGFPMKKITSNDRLLLQDLPGEDLLDEDFLKFDDSSTVKTLGIRWNAKGDYFYYIVDPIETQPTTTKRTILSTIAKLFDPLGWVGPIVITAKLLMQELWKEKSGWDEAVSSQNLTKWNLFAKNLPYISNIKFPRWTNFAPPHNTQLHGFCDASEKAYCAVVFMRTESPQGMINSSLLVAKTKVAPLKRTTIPKLELCGALLLTKLVRNLVSCFSFPYELFLWTDSSIVLGWLQKDPNTLKTFVGNRVAQILSASSANQWRHVKTEENPADLGSRGCCPQELAQSTLWWNGPPWLLQPVLDWPIPRRFGPSDLETKKDSSASNNVNFAEGSITNFHLRGSQVEFNSQTITVETSTLHDTLERFSSLDRALRVISYQFRFIHRIMKNPTSTEKWITYKEIAFTKGRLISMAQQLYFGNEYKSLKEKRHLSRKSRLLSLNPFLDNNDLMRVSGRLDNAGLSYSEKHPIILPETSHFARLLVDFTHRILLHAEHNIMLRAIRQEFYIPRLKNLVRKCIRNCKACTIYKQKLQQQIMAALPPERVKFSLPFTYTGVDFAGPFSIKTSNIRNAKIVKGYAAVFVCFSTRAVHLEPCSDLSVNAFLACFSRFTGRRGLPKTLFSDNGRNFIGANRVLLNIHNTFLKTAEEALINKYSALGFTWSFIPPYAPHMGGIWEAAVKSMKTHLKKITNSMNFTFEEFTTLLVRIEAVLNSRPLSPLTETPSELLPLTPGHFLRGAPIVAPPESASDPPLKNLTQLKRWDQLKALQHIFAKRWKNEYITELQRRYKWKKERNNIKPEDIVIVKDDQLPPTEWRLGRVINVVPGKDGKVRVADIITQNGIIRRPIVKICILPTTANC